MNQWTACCGELDSRSQPLNDDVDKQRKHKSCSLGDWSIRCGACAAAGGLGYLILNKQLRKEEISKWGK